MLSMSGFLGGALAMATWVAGLFFLRFWRDTRDRLFAFFTAAFWILSADWIAIAIAGPNQKTMHYFYLVRLLAFCLILVGIADKNRRDQ